MENRGIWQEKQILERVFLFCLFLVRTTSTLNACPKIESTLGLPGVYVNERGPDYGVSTHILIPERLNIDLYSNLIKHDQTLAKVLCSVIEEEQNSVKPQMRQSEQKTMLSVKFLRNWLNNPGEFDLRGVNCP